MSKVEQRIVEEVPRVRREKGLHHRPGTGCLGGLCQRQTDMDELRSGKFEQIQLPPI